MYSTLSSRKYFPAGACISFEKWTRPPYSTKSEVSYAPPSVVTTLPFQEWKSGVVTIDSWTESPRSGTGIKTPRPSPFAANGSP